MKNINLKELFKNKTTIYLSIVLGLLLVISVSYAYFSITVNGNEEAKDITVTTGNLSLYYNSRPYYNRISEYIEITCSKWHDTTRSKPSVCNYESNALTSEAKNQISSTKWYLGSVNYDRNAKEIYIQERSTNVNSGNKQTWDGEVALIYPSDYIYASSACYNDDTIKGYNTSDSSKDYRSETCTSTNWLFDINKWYWTMAPCSHNSSRVMNVNFSGYVANDFTTSSSSGGLRQSIYLNTNLNYVSGDGTKNNPFVIN